jgi:hypothetical protein
MIGLAERCRCGDHLMLCSFPEGDFTVHCDRCYDPAEDAPLAAILVGRGPSPEHAFEDYCRLREDIDAEPVYVPTELSTFIVPRAPEGYVISPDGDDPARLFFETLTSAERHPELGPLYYGPLGVQKAANDT